MLKPLGNRVVLDISDKEEVSKSGIILTESAKEKPSQGLVVAVGEGKRTDDGRRLAPEVKEGDTVVFQQYAGTEVKDGETTYLILSEDEILAILN